MCVYDIRHTTTRCEDTIHRKFTIAKGFAVMISRKREIKAKRKIFHFAAKQLLSCAKHIGTTEVGSARWQTKADPPVATTLRTDDVQALSRRLEAEEGEAMQHAAGLAWARFDYQLHELYRTKP